MQVETQLSDQIARYLDLATSEAKLTAANMANVDTPGYRAVGMDFEAEMREAMTEVDQGASGASGARHGSGRTDCAARRQQRLDGPGGPESGRGAAEIQDRRGAAPRRSISGSWTQFMRMASKLKSSVWDS